MGRAVHSQDRTLWVLRDPTEINDPIVTHIEDDAFDMWSKDTSWDVFAFNPIENWAMPLNAEFEDRFEEERIEARSMQRHYDSLRVAS